VAGDFTTILSNVGMVQVMQSSQQTTAGWERLAKQTIGIDLPSSARPQSQKQFIASQLKQLPLVRDFLCRSLVQLHGALANGGKL